MKLTELVREIGNIDQNAIIFQEDISNPDSDIIISFPKKGDEGIKIEKGRKYYYLIEIFIAKEFIEELEACLDYQPSIEEKAKRLYDYAINDA